MMRLKLQTLTGTSPAAVGTSEIARIGGLAHASCLRIDAALVGATGGTLDIYLQRRIYGTNIPTASSGIWVDWLHFAQLTAGNAALKYTLWAGDNDPNTTILAVGQMSDDLLTGAPALAAATFTGGLPGDAIRCIAVAGAGTSAGALVTIYVTQEELFT